VVLRGYDEASGMAFPTQNTPVKVAKAIKKRVTTAKVNACSPVAPSSEYRVTTATSRTP